jgi:hypothetical protein
VAKRAFPIPGSGNLSLFPYRLKSFAVASMMVVLEVALKKLSDSDNPCQASPGQHLLMRKISRIKVARSVCFSNAIFIAQSTNNLTMLDPRAATTLKD